MLIRHFLLVRYLLIKSGVVSKLDGLENFYEQGRVLSQQRGKRIYVYDGSRSLRRGSVFAGADAAFEAFPPS